MTDYICPICGSPLEASPYFSKGTRKIKLWCSDATARLNEDHKSVIYYPSGKGKFWSFGLKAHPILANAGESVLPPIAVSPAPATKPRPKRRRERRAHNRQRQLSL